MALIMVAVIAISQLLWVIATTAVSWLANYDFPLDNDYSYLKDWLSSLTINIISFALLYFAFVGLYRWVPKTRVRWREALIGAAFATLTMLIASRVYIWYLGSSFASERVIYGSLGTTLGVIIFFYINAWIVLFGAHLTSAVGYCINQKRAAQPGGRTD
jgi:membrane protein